MTYNDIKILLSENFCKGGVYDNAGHWRYTASGNTVYLADNKSGWAYICKGINNNGYMHIVKYSIDANGKMKNSGKYVKALWMDIGKMLNKATKYAIEEPWAEVNTPLQWVKIERSQP